MRIARSTVGGVIESRKWLARVIALATLTLGIAAMPSQATTITHTFSPGNPVNDYVFTNGVATGTDPAHISTFRLGFDHVLTTFDITITDSYASGDTLDVGPDTYSCIEMGQGLGAVPTCVRFTATGNLPDDADADLDPELPQLGVDYLGGVGDGAINIGIQYAIHGYPDPFDPVDLGQTDNFSIFMVFALVQGGPNPLPKTFLFAMGHIPSGESEFEDITSGHCGASLPTLDACAEARSFEFTAVPEPATLELLLVGLIGMAITVLINRRS
jgi:hypothetical protein